MIDIHLTPVNVKSGVACKTLAVIYKELRIKEILCVHEVSQENNSVCDVVGPSVLRVYKVIFECE